MAKIPEIENTKAEPSRRSILSEHQPHQEPPAPPPLDNKVRRLVGASTTPDSPSARHRALLTDPRWNSRGSRTIQRAIVLQLQQQFGNAYVGRLLGSDEVSRTVSGDSVVQAARPATVAAVARKPLAAPAPVPLPSVAAKSALAAAPAASAKAETESPVLSPSPADTTAAPTVPPKRGAAAPKPVAEQSAAKAERIVEVAAEEGATPTAGKVKSGEAPAVARAKGAAPASP